LNKLFILSTFYRSWVIHRGIPLTFWCNGHPTTWAFSTSEFEGFQRKTKFNKFFSQLQSFNRFFGQTSAFLVAISTHFWVFCQQTTFSNQFLILPSVFFVFCPSFEVDLGIVWFPIISFSVFEQIQCIFAAFGHPQLVWTKFLPLFPQNFTFSE
jgi:hypothetical protein